MVNVKRNKNPLVDYENKWVALDEKQSKVVLASETLLGLQKKIKQQEDRNLVVTRVMPFDVYLAPNVKKTD